MLFSHTRKMGESKALISILFLLIFLSSSSAKPGTKKHYKPCKTLVLYFHDILYNGTNADNSTAAIVGSPEGSNRTALNKPFFFGDTIVFDDPVTLDNNLRSPPVGRAQGMYVWNSKSSFNAMFVFSFVLNSTDYHGSINCIGDDATLAETRDLSVVGGTGDFFMHRGIATLRTDGFEDQTYFRLRVDIKFYECW